MAKKRKGTARKKAFKAKQAALHKKKIRKVKIQHLKTARKYNYGKKKKPVKRRK